MSYRAHEYVTALNAVEAEFLNSGIRGERTGCEFVPPDDEPTEIAVQQALYSRLPCTISTLHNSEKLPLPVESIVWRLVVLTWYGNISEALLLCAVS